MANSAERRVNFILGVQVANDLRAQFDVLRQEAERLQRVLDQLKIGGAPGVPAGSPGGGGSGPPRGGGPGRPAPEMFAGKTLREWEKISAGIDRELKKQEDATMRFWAGEAKKIDKAIADREKAEKRAAQNSAREQEQAAAKIRAANGQLRESFERTTEGVLKLGRGFAQLGLVGEKDMQRIVQTLLKVQGAIDLTRGGIDLGRGIMGGVDAGLARMGMAGGTGFAGAAVSGAGAAAATAALTALAAAAYVATDGLNGLGAIGGVRPGGIKDRIATKEVEIAGQAGVADWAALIAGGAFGPAGVNAGGPINFEGDLGQGRFDKVAVARQRRLETEQQNQGIDAGFRRQMREDQLPAFAAFQNRLRGEGVTAIDMERRSLGFSRRQADVRMEQVEGQEALARQRGNGRLSGNEEKEFANARKQVLQEMLGIEQQMADVTRRAGMERVDRLREAQGIAAQFAQSENQRLLAEQNKLESDAERFAKLDPDAQINFRNLAQRFQRGDQLGTNELSELQQFETFRNQARQRLVDRGLSASGDLFGAQQERVEQAEAAAAQAQAIQANVDTKIQVELTANEQQLQEAFAGPIQQLLDKIQEIVEGQGRNVRDEMNAQDRKGRELRNRGQR